MNHYLKRVGAAIGGAFGGGAGTSLGAVRPARLIYTLAYPLELILFSFRGHYFEIPDTPFGLSGVTAALAVHGLASLLVMLLWTPRFRPLIRISVAVTAAGLAPFFLLPQGGAKLVFALIGYAGLGGAVTAARCGYAFAVSDAERLFGIVLMFLATSLIRCVDLPETAPPALAAGIALGLLAAMCFCLLRFRETDFEVKEVSDAGDVRGLYWALAYFIAYFAVDGYLWEILSATGRAHDGFLLTGLLLACAALLLMLRYLKRNMWLVWNFFFVAASVTALLAGFSPLLRDSRALNLFAGLTVIGWPLCIYMLACAQGYFASYRLLKQCTVVFVLASPLTNFSDDLTERLFPNALPTVTMAVLIGIVLALLILSPYSYKYLFSSLWVRKLPDDAVTRGEEEEAPAAQTTVPPAQTTVPPAETTPGEDAPEDPLDSRDLTPRQKEVARLLLAAKTRRQIAGELGVSESTVKTHTAELYKKLGINSRVELFRMFGVRDGET